MYCNGFYIKPIIFLMILVMGSAVVISDKEMLEFDKAFSFLSKSSSASASELESESSESIESTKQFLTKRERESISKSLDSLNGNLYDVFKRRLDLIQDELYYDPYNERKKKNNFNSNHIEEALGTIVLPPLPLKEYNPLNWKRSTVKDDLYEEYKARMDKNNRGPNMKMTSKYTDCDNRCRSSRGLLDWFKKPKTTVTKSYDRSTESRINVTKNSNRFLDRVLHDFSSSNSVKQELVDEYQKQLAIIQSTLSALNRLENISNTHPTNAYTTKNSSNAYYTEDDMCLEARNWLRETEPSATHKHYHFNWDNKLINRRQANANATDSMEFMDASKSNGITNSTNNPSMLTRALEISLNPANKANNGNLLDNVAKKLNTSVLELAQNIVKSEDINPLTIKNDILPFQRHNAYSNIPYQYQVLPQTITASYPLLPLQNITKVNADANTNAIANAYADANSNANYEMNVNHNFASNSLNNINPNINLNGAVMPNMNAEFAYAPPAQPPPNMYSINSFPYQDRIREDFAQLRSRDKMLPHVEEASRIDQDLLSNPNLSGILDEILKKLKIIQEIKDEEHPNGTPCQLYGNWSSQLVGLCFTIELVELEEIHASQNNRSLNINIHNCVPPKSQHNSIIDLTWKFTGSFVKDTGGPIYIFAEKSEENLVATFLGFCRTCGGIDTIFGGWHFLMPSKDCTDILLAFEFKNDIMKRVRLEDKIKARLKKLYHKMKMKK